MNNGYTTGCNLPVFGGENLLIVGIHAIAEIPAVTADGQLVPIGLVVHLEVTVFGRFGDTIPSGDPEQSSHSIFCELVNLVQSWNCGHQNHIKMIRR